jgi:hypothetical protein
MERKKSRDPYDFCWETSVADEDAEKNAGDRALKYWPLVAAGAVVLVSVFNIGYFTTLGMHFIGVMDISNVVYPIGLIFALLIGPVIFFPDRLLGNLKEFAHSNELASRLPKARKWIFGILLVAFSVGLFVHQAFISIMTLFAIYFVLAFLALAAYLFIVWERTGEVSTQMAASMTAFGFFTLFWIGGAVAYHEAFTTRTVYLVTTKDATYDNARIARTSSSGFLIAKDKHVIFIPSGRMKSIMAINPIDQNP